MKVKYGSILSLIFFSLLVAEYLLASSKWLVIFGLDYFNEYSETVWYFFSFFCLFFVVVTSAIG